MSTFNHDMETFIKISVHLTGFSDIELLGTGMTSVYFNVLRNHNQVDVFEAFLTKSRQIIESSDHIKNDISSELMPVFLYNGMAQNLITLWYTGSMMNGKIVSSQAYIQGLIWNTASAHPPGAKQQGYGSWSKAPNTNI
jgi:hypothetical protein